MRFVSGSIVSREGKSTEVVHSEPTSNRFLPLFANRLALLITTAVNMDRRLVCFVGSLFVISVTTANAEFTTIKHETCGGNFNAVRVDPCPTLPCVFKKGMSFKMETDFTADKNLDTLRMKLIGNIGGAWLPFPGFRKNACRKHGLTCPLEAGKQYTLQASLKLQPSFPTLETDIEWSMSSRDNHTVFCFRVPIKLVD
ncbi:NPC intracellular cholesterol transporter 2-like [Ornithodoros turicata]